MYVILSLILPITAEQDLMVLLFISNKAVSDGAVSFYLRRQVRSRVSKFAYGPIFSINYDPENPEHRVHQQRGSVYVSATGRKRIAGSFKVMIPKVALSTFLYVVEQHGLMPSSPAEHENPGKEGVPPHIYLSVCFSDHSEERSDRYLVLSRQQL